MNVVVLATCHNRRELTLRALRSLYDQQLPGTVSLEVVIVDDGSTDQTTDAVREEFPHIQIIQGAGSLYWAGGMRYSSGMKAAITRKLLRPNGATISDIRPEEPF